MSRQNKKPVHRWPHNKEFILGLLIGTGAIAGLGVTFGLGWVLLLGFLVSLPKEDK